MRYTTFAVTGLFGLVLSSLGFTAPTTRPYPLTTCVVSDEKLGEMGDPVILNYEGREIRLCCEGCVEKFKKNPATYIKKIDEAAKPSAPTTQP